MKYKVLKFEQPGGTFFSSVLPVKELLKIAVVYTRSYNEEGELVTENFVQREHSGRRLSEISAYSLDDDATFPTPIVLSVSSSDVDILNEHINFKNINQVAEVIDGQHRIKGIELAFNTLEGFEKLKDVEIPVVFIVDAELEQKAYIFATINSKQTKVSSSLIADLYGVTEKNTPRKVAHEIARALNSSNRSPFHGRLKMLGSGSGGSYSTLSQGTFVRELLKLISSTPDKDGFLVKKEKPIKANENLPFNGYFIKGEFDTIMKILENYFNAVSRVWSVEWKNSEEFILLKTVGFEALMQSLGKIIDEGKKSSDLSQDFFYSYFQGVKKLLIDKNIPLTSKHFKSQYGDVKKLKYYILSFTTG